MIIKHLYESQDRDNLQSLVNDIKELRKEIKNIERDIATVFSHVRPELLSEEDRARYKEITDKINALRSQASELRAQYEETIWHRSGDDVDFEINTKNAALKAELEPKVQELEDEANQLSREVKAFEDQMHELDIEDVKNRRSAAGYEQKKLTLSDKEESKRKLDAELIKKYQLDTAAEVIEQILEETFDDVSIINISCYPTASSVAPIAAYIEYEAIISDLDPDDFDGYDEYSRYQEIELSDEFVESVEESVREDLSEPLEVGEDIQFNIDLDGISYTDSTKVKATYEKRTYGNPGGWDIDISGAVTFKLQISVEIFN